MVLSGEEDCLSPGAALLQREELIVYDPTEQPHGVLVCDTSCVGTKVKGRDITIRLVMATVRLLTPALRQVKRTEVADIVLRGAHVWCKKIELLKKFKDPLSRKELVSVGGDLGDVVLEGLRHDSSVKQVFPLGPE